MRVMKRRHRWRFTLVAVASIVLANAVALLVVFSDDEPMLLSVGNTELMWRGERAVIMPSLHNDGDSTVELLGASVPGVRDAGVMRSAGEWVLEKDAHLPVRGLKIAVDSSDWLEIFVPARCPNAPTVKTLDVRMRVDGREVTQSLAMPKIVADRCA